MCKIFSEKFAIYSKTLRKDTINPSRSGIFIFIYIIIYIRFVFG